MSKFEVHRVTCRDCGHDQRVDIYISISADRMRQAADQLIDGSWERFTCDACGKPFVVDNRLLYVDLPRKRWIVRYPYVECGDYRALEDEAARVFEIEYLRHPPEPIRRRAAGVSPRICFGRPQLAEKLLAWCHDLDDRALECLKLVLLRDHGGTLLPLGPATLRLAKIDDDRITFNVVALSDERPLERFTVRRAAYDAVAGDLESYRAAFPALFDHPYVDARRYLQPAAT